MNEKADEVRPMDRFVGARIRERRLFLGLKQQHLAENVGVKFQQIQKYETGYNRISASRLWQVAKALGVQPEYFFEGRNGMDHKVKAMSSSPAIQINPVFDKEAIALLRYYFEIPEKKRIKFLELVRSLVPANS